MKLRDRLILVMLLGSAGWLIAAPAFAQAGGGAVTLHVNYASPVVALIAGILILIFPRLLNYIVAIYLILIGLIGFLGR
jgi:Protein of unknown function (DUF3096)